MEVYMIRHTAVDVPFGVCYGQTDVPLKDSFEKEAAIVKENLRSISFDACFTSPLSRCTRLASYCGYPDATRDDRLKELNFGDWEMQEFNRIQDPRLAEWFRDYLHVPATNGESLEQLHTRVAFFLDELKTGDYECAAIFAHGGVLIAAQVYAGLVDADKGFKNLTSYGGMIRLLL
ncbi:MAG: alpha-ribazole phosphatase [Tannerella sp.]|jgi:alpha-ribazole phosphatase|nr:alpha-ribazole phosphatase [Tannerella sp.]